MNRRPLSSRLLLCVVLAGGLAACSTGSDRATTAPAPTSPVQDASEPAAAPPSPAAQLIEVTYAGGKITGVEPRVPVRLGEQVLLRVTSDVPEQIHVHGYDVVFDLTPGQPAEATFTADAPGAYEVELHKARRPLFQLRVS